MSPVPSEMIEFGLTCQIDVHATCQPIATVTLGRGTRDGHAHMFHPPNYFITTKAEQRNMEYRNLSDSIIASPQRYGTRIRANGPWRSKT
jgi:hypothetical protein